MSEIQRQTTFYYTFLHFFKLFYKFLHFFTLSIFAREVIEILLFVIDYSIIIEVNILKYTHVEKLNAVEEVIIK